MEDGCTTPDPPLGSSTLAPTTTASIGTSTTTSPPSSTTSSTTTAAVDPNIPAAATANTAEGAVAFATYFLTQANRAYANLDSVLYSKYVSSSCGTCSAMTSTIASYTSKNYRYEGDFVTPTFITINSFNDKDISVLVASDTKESKLFNAHGSLVDTIPAAKGNVAIQLTWLPLGWQVFGIKGI